MSVGLVKSLSSVMEEADVFRRFLKSIPQAVERRGIEICLRVFKELKGRQTENFIRNVLNRRTNQSVFLTDFDLKWADVEDSDASLQCSSIDPPLEREEEVKIEVSTKELIQKNLEKQITADKNESNEKKVRWENCGKVVVKGALERQDQDPRYSAAVSILENARKGLEKETEVVSKGVSILENARKGLEKENASEVVSKGLEGENKVLEGEKGWTVEEKKLVTKGERKVRFSLPGELRFSLPELEDFLPELERNIRKALCTKHELERKQKKKSKRRLFHQRIKVKGKTDIQISESEDLDCNFFTVRKQCPMSNSLFEKLMSELITFRKA